MARKVKAEVPADPTRCKRLLYLQRSKWSLHFEHHMHVTLPRVGLHVVALVGLIEDMELAKVRSLVQLCATPFQALRPDTLVALVSHSICFSNQNGLGWFALTSGRAISHGTVCKKHTNRKADFALRFAF